MSRLEELQELCAVMYQIAGVSGLDNAVLDMLASAASGKEFGDPMSLLPYESNNIVDAERYRHLREAYQEYDYLLVDQGGNIMNEELCMPLDASLDDLVDKRIDIMNRCGE